jgi:hypothetical protein
VYKYRLVDSSGRVIGPEKTQRGGTRIPVPEDVKTRRFYGFEIQTQRASWISKPLRVYFYVWAPDRYQIVRVERVD